MFLRELNDPVTKLKGAGPSAAGNLERLGIVDIRTLLCHYPRDWEDRSRIQLLKDWNSGRVCTEVQVLAHDWFGFGKTKTLKVYVEDDSARACLVCFNRPFLQRQLPVGIRCKLYGQFYFRFGEIQSTAFEVEPLNAKTASFGPILPIYPLSMGLTQGQLRKLISQAIQQYAPSLDDELPESIILRDKLYNKVAAIKAIHFPDSQESLDRARKTLIYEELFYLELMVGKRTLQRKSFIQDKNISLKPKIDMTGEMTLLQNRFLERLPFSLTPGQQAAIKEINASLDGPYPMARLLQGDVGSGKTLVSFLAALKAVEKGAQAALLAPTELLARQHAENAARYLEPLGIRIAFLSGNIKSAGRVQLLKAMAEGEIDFVIGTHALFSSDVIYKNLSFVVVDEQHRFGVLQRQAIMAKGTKTECKQGPEGPRVPDLLMMSATPIPRSLALTVFGDLDVSVIRDLPPGRKPVKTHLAKESNEEKVYDFVRKEMEAGRQAYFVYPLIEGGDELKDAVFMAERLAKEVFPGLPIRVLHSKVNEEEKSRTMDDFRRGDIKILAATSVVEVGVDVPNASCMVIEHAERFGLSALHQLRGRVGRGADQSYCFLVYSDNLGEDGKMRLKVMLENSDGFIIAEEDLKLRGPGQITGIEQSGYLKLGIADPIRDLEQLGQAREDAFAILESDPSLEQSEHRRIAEVLERAPPFGEMTAH